MGRVGGMGICCRCITSLGAATCSLVLLLMNTVDFTGGMLLLLTMFLGAWGSLVANATIAGYGFFLLVLVVFVSCLGVMKQPGRRCLSMSAITALIALFFELALVACVAVAGRKTFESFTRLKSHGKTADIVSQIIKQYWVFAVFASRHILRYLLTVGLRSARDDIANDQANSATLEQENTLSERLIQREIRRGHREDLRAHFNHKYFDGRTTNGDPSPTVQDQRPRAELPSYVFSEHRNSLTSGEDSQLDWAT